jgi:hypothetical protein
MKQETVINSVLRDMKLQKLITEDDSESVEAFLNQIWMIAWQERTRMLTAHRKRKIYQFNREGDKVGEFESIRDAAKANGISRDMIDDSVSGRTAYTRKHGYYFRYASNGDTTDSNG